MTFDGNEDSNENKVRPKLAGEVTSRAYSTAANSNGLVVSPEDLFRSYLLCFVESPAAAAPSAGVQMQICGAIPVFF